MISQREYARLLGYPRGKRLEGAVSVRAVEAREWFDAHARPRVVVRNGVAAITAGFEVEAEIALRWKEDRVDEAYFLDRFAAGVVEQLAREVGVSPGADGWDVSCHGELLGALGPESPVELLPSGMLKPLHSLIARVTGRRTACSACAAACGFRRTA